MLPPFPGLDGGDHGHWGKYNQNNHKDNRINHMDMGSVVVSRMEVGKSKLHKSVNLKLGENGSMSAAFDPWTLSYRAIWRDGFIAFNPHRWGVSRGVSAENSFLFTHDGTWMDVDAPKGRPIPGAKYHGYSRHGNRVVFSYQLKGVSILDHPWTIGEAELSWQARFVKRRY